MGWITEKTLGSLLQYWLPMEDVWFSFSSLFLSRHHTRSYRELNDSSLLCWTHLRVGKNAHARAVKRIWSTARRRLYMAIAFKAHFQFSVEVLWDGRLSKRTVSFIGRTLNRKAWWGVYWSPDPVLHSLNWFMDSISGARAAGVHVGVQTRLAGIHHAEQAASAAPPCRTLTRPLQVFEAMLTQGKAVCLHTHADLKRLADLHKYVKLHGHKSPQSLKLPFHYTNCVSFMANAKWG